MKFILFMLINFSLFAANTTINFNLQSNGQSNTFKMTSPLGKTSSITKNNFSVEVLPEKATIQNMNGIVLKLKVLEGSKTIATPTLFVKPGVEAEFSKANFPNAPENFSLKVKADI